MNWKLIVWKNKKDENKEWNEDALKKSEENGFLQVCFKFQKREVSNDKWVSVLVNFYFSPSLDLVQF